jgi:hypothetical protein
MAISDFLRISKPEVEGQMAVSKALKFQVLLDGDEMQALMEELAPLHIFIVSDVVNQREASLTPCRFLEIYRLYIDTLKAGNIPDFRLMRPYFSSLFTHSSEILYAHQVRENGYLIKPLKPVVQLQAHHFFYSELDKKFHPMVLSDTSVTWGIQFSYPQIYQDPKTGLFSKVTSQSDFPNTPLFLHLTRWIRRQTRPTPFIHEGAKTFVPMRLGKQCFSWINSHPQFQNKALAVAL